MNLHDRVRRQPNRPSARHERRAATVCALLLLLAAASVLLTGPTRSVRARHGHKPAVQVSSAAPPPRWTPALTADTKTAAERFLAGYLAYLYGQVPASEVNDATGAFTQSLEHPSRVPPGIRALHPRILSITVTPQTAKRAIATAIVTDSEVVHYPIRLVLTQSRRGWRVRGLLQSAP